MNIKTLLAVIGLIFIVIVSVYLANAKPKDTNPASAQTGTGEIYQVGHALPVNEIRGYVNTSRPGFMVIHTTNNGELIEMIGESALTNGESDLITAPISQSLSEGQVVAVTLFIDDGDGKYNLQKDTSVFTTPEGIPAQFFLPITTQNH